MTRLIYYNPDTLKRRILDDVPGIRMFRHFNTLFGSQNLLIDRTQTLQTPFEMRHLSLMPALRAQHKTFEVICNERAIELLNRAASLRAPLYVMWSGGIDSTLVLVSLLKNSTAAQKENITVLMNEESIIENPAFYRAHIQRQLKMEVSGKLPYLLGSNVLLVTGEQNDQLQGTRHIGKFMQMFGARTVHMPYQRETLHAFLSASVQDDAVVNFYLDILERVIQASPIPIRTYAEYLWWLNFSLKWQCTYTRMLRCVSEQTAPHLTHEYLNARVAPFYGTEEFQLWSLNNPDMRIKDTWQTYKWVCKDIIYEFTKDVVYRDTKTKHPSLISVMRWQHRFMYIDENMHFLKELDYREYYTPKNDFVLSG